MNPQVVVAQVGGQVDTTVPQVADQVGTVVYQDGAKVSQASPEHYQVGKTD